MTREDYKDYYSRIAMFVLPFPLSIGETMKYLSVLPEDAVILSTNVNDFGRRTEVLIRHESFPPVEEGTYSPEAVFIIKKRMLMNDEGTVDTTFHIVGWEIGECNRYVIEKAVQCNEERGSSNS